MARRSEIWLGDVVAAVHALTPDDEAIAELVRMCGLSAAAAWPETVQQEPPPRPDIQPPVGTPPAAAPETLRRERVEPPVSPPTRIFSTLTRIGSMPTTPQAPAWVQSVEPLAPSAAPTPRKPRPLFSHLHRRSIISYALATTVNEGALDVREIVRRIGRGLPIRSLPRKPRRTLRFGAEVLLDRSPWMEPFFQEQDALIDYLDTLLPSERLTITEFSGTPWRQTGVGRRPMTQKLEFGQRAPVLALSDVGAGYRFGVKRPPSPDDWLAFVSRIQRVGREFVAFVPYERSRWTPTLATRIPMLHWSERTTAGAAMGVRTASRRRLAAPVATSAPVRSEAVLALARVLSLAVRVEPWLLRESRIRLTPQVDVGAEADLWFSGYVASRGPAGLVFKAAAAHALREELRQQGEAAVRDAAALVAGAHADAPKSMQIEEGLRLLSAEGHAVPARVDELLRPALKSLAARDASSSDVARWVAHAWERLPQDVRAAPAARQVALAAAVHLRAGEWLRAGETALEIPDDMAWLLPPAEDTVALGVEVARWPDGELVLQVVEPSVRTNAHHRLSVPRTQPAWIEIRGDDEDDSPRKTDSELLPAEPGASTVLTGGGGPRQWSVQTLAGDRFRLSLPDVAAAIGPSLVYVTRKDGQPGTGSLTGIVITASLVVAAREWLEDGAEVVVWSASRNYQYRALVRRAADSSWTALWIPEASDSQGGLDGLLPLDAAARPAIEPLVSAPRIAWLDPTGGLTLVDLEPSRDGYAPAFSMLHQKVPDAGGLLVKARDERYGLLMPYVVDKSGAVTLFQSESLPAIVEQAERQRLERWRCYIAYMPGAAEAAHLIHKALTARLGSGRVYFDRGSQFQEESRPSTLPRGVDALDAFVWVGAPPTAEGIRRELDHVRALHIPLLWVPLADRPAEILATLPEALRDLFSRRAWLAPPDAPSPLTASGAEWLAGAIAQWDPFTSSPAPGAAAASTERRWQVQDIFAGLGTSVRTQLLRRADAVNEYATGLYHVPLMRPFSRQPFVVPRGPDPILLLIHGEMSDAAGSFGQLWAESKASHREALLRHYGDRVLVYEYRSITESLFKSAADLAERLPAGATLHLVTVSGGGLIGELLCRSERTDGRPFDEQDFAIVEQGPPRGDADAIRMLADELARKRFRIPRFVRVACGARGVTLFRDAPEKSVELFQTLSWPFWPARMLGSLTLKPLRTLFRDGDASPGIVQLAPDSALIRLLNRPDIETRSDLTIVAGVAEEKGIISTLTLWMVRSIHMGDTDLLVQVDSNFGGMKRAGGARSLVDRGPDVSHFSYFSNERTAAAIVGALIEGSARRPEFTAAPVGETPHS